MPASKEIGTPQSLHMYLGDSVFHLRRISWRCGNISPYLKPVMNLRVSMNSPVSQSIISKIFSSCAGCARTNGSIAGIVMSPTSLHTFLMRTQYEHSWLLIKNAFKETDISLLKCRICSVSLFPHRLRPTDSADGHY